MKADDLLRIRCHEKKHRLKEHDLTALLLLAEGPLMVGSLTEKLTVQSSQTSRLIGDLRRRKLISTRVPVENRRRVEVSITEKGLRLTKLEG